jgi:hypothetical protein
MWSSTIGVINGRHSLFVVYIFVTTIICGELFFSGSFSASGAGLLGSALCYFGSVSFVGSWHARREHNYRAGDLWIIGTFAALLSATGIALLAWSGLRFKVFDVVIGGPVWAVIGVVIAIVVSKTSWSRRKILSGRKNPSPDRREAP